MPDKNPTTLPNKAKFDYSLLCDCGYEQHRINTLTEARKEARKHLNVSHPKTIQYNVFIDQLEVDGELTDRYWMVNNKSV